MIWRFLLIALLLSFVACGGPAKSTAPPVDPAPVPVDQPDAGVAATEGDAGSAALTATECDRLVDHVVGLAAAMRTGEASSTDEEIAAAKERLRTEMRASCLPLSRAMYDCVMRATDAAGVAACQPPEDYPGDPEE